MEKVEDVLMKWRNLIVLLKKRLWKNKFMGISLTVMLTIAFVLVCSAVLEFQMGNYKIYKVRRFFKKTDVVYNINLNTFKTDEIISQKSRQFVNGLKQLEGVERSGRYFNTTIIFKELLNDLEFIEKNGTIIGWQEEALPYYLDICYLDKELFFLFGITNDERVMDEGIIPVLVGKDYEGILKVGDIYTDNYNSGCKYQVIGVLSEGIEIPNKLLLFGGEDICLDQKIVAAYDDRIDRYNQCAASYMNSVYVVTDGSDKTLNAIREYAKQCELHPTVLSIEELIDSYWQSNFDFFMYNSLFTGIALLSCFLAMVAISVIQIILNKREYGIYYANGISKRDVARLIIAENGLREFIAFIIAAGFAYYRIKAETLVSYNMEEYLYIFKTQVIWIVLLLLLILLVFSSLIPIIILNRTKTTELIGGHEI